MCNLYPPLMDTFFFCAKQGAALQGATTNIQNVPQEGVLNGHRIVWILGIVGALAVLTTLFFFTLPRLRNQWQHQEPHSPRIGANPNALLL